MKFFLCGQIAPETDASHGAMRHLLAIGLTTLTLLPTVAFADAPARAEIRHEDFEDELVSGDYASPNAEVLTVRTGRAHRTLIRARTHFSPEMMRSVENL
jgi:hypothetical protein